MQTLKKDIFKEVGAYRQYTKCRFCFSQNLNVILDFGLLPLAGGFIKKEATAEDFRTERKYPLQICFCSDCYLVQVTTIVDSAILYKDYFYFSSAIKTLVDHFQAYALDLAKLYPDPSKRFVVELGCNDGVFLKPLAKLGFKVMGVDPAKNVVEKLVKEGYEVMIDYFNEQSVAQIVKKHGQADLILSSNSFAHIEDMHDVMKGVKKLLKKDGVLAFEVHYLGTLLKEVQYDMIYHDHEYYYSLLTLEKFFTQYNMEVYDVKAIPVHAGSMRYYVQNTGSGSRSSTENLKALHKTEKQLKIDKLDTYIHFESYIQKTRKDLLRLLNKLKKQGKKVVGYGASGRATTIMNYCGITDDLIEYIVDDAPAKTGAFTPGNHLEIRSSQILDSKNRPDYCVVFAWSFIDEIIRKKQTFLNNGGRFIVPLPAVKIIGN